MSGRTSLPPVTRKAEKRPASATGRRSLNIIVEDGNLVAIFVQQAESRVIGEILELDHDAREHGARRGDEFVDELVIGGAGEALLTQPT